MTLPNTSSSPETADDSTPNASARFMCDSVRQAPASVGLYAWYGSIATGPADWSLSVKNGADEGTPRFLSLLARHTTRHNLSPIQLTGSSSFATQFRGSLCDETQAALHKALSDGYTREGESAVPEGTYDERRASVARAVAGVPAQRRALADVLRTATPIFAAPLYIGVATNLRQRLEKHAKNIFAASRWLQENPDKREEMRNHGTFGGRAVGAGFSPDTLEVWTMNLDLLLSELTSVEKQRTVAEASEWFLNRWHRPMLGRR
jgi:hypothetical protein